MVIKLCRKSGRVAIVEPNRRPAGMQIWSLAHRTFGVDFYHSWIESLLGYPPSKASDSGHRSSGIRMIRAPLSGTVTADFTLLKQDLIEMLESCERAQIFRPFSENLEFSECSVTLKKEQKVQKIPENNGDFVGHICLSSDQLDTEELAIFLNLAEIAIQAKMIAQIRGDNS